MLYPEEWREADDETRCLKLDTPEATTFVNRRIRTIRKKYGGRTVLLGGPPCQSYSLVGRARNAGNAAYDPSKDERQSLYRVYVSVLRQLRPAVAILENVKGMLSARHRGHSVFDRVMASLGGAGGADGYRLYAIGFGAWRWLLGAGPRSEGLPCSCRGVRSATGTASGVRGLRAAGYCGPPAGGCSATAREKPTRSCP